MPPAPELAADAFLRAACLDYERWSPAALPEARALLAAHPELVRASFLAACAAGDAGAVRAALAREPALATKPGGPHAWEPLLYACYSRFAAPGRSTRAVAELLLAHGADANAGFLWHGNVPPFTALTGVFGEGEDGINQPPHPERDALARLLLEHGADPNDGQTLYNRHFRADDGHLVLLLEFGLGTERGGPWYARLGERLHGPTRLLVEELWAAAKKGYVERVELLLAHGVELDTPGVRNGRTVYEEALLAGQRGIAELLARQGARRVELDELEAFGSACVAGARDEVRARLAHRPTILEELGARAPELVGRAVEARSLAGIHLLAELGVELSPLTRNTPLHDAAWAGDLEIVQLLVELGARTDLRDPAYGGTPLGWAAHNRQPAVVAFLLAHADLFDAVAHGAPARVAELLAADPALARATDSHGRAPVHHLRPGLAHADEMLDLLRTHGADLDALDPRGRTALEAALADGHTELVALLRRHGAG